MTVQVGEIELAEAQWWIGLIDVLTSAQLGFNADTGEVASRSGVDGLSAAEQTRVNRLFDQIEDSVEIVELAE